MAPVAYTPPAYYDLTSLPPMMELELKPLAKLVHLAEGLTVEEMPESLQLEYTESLNGRLVQIIDEASLAAMLQGPERITRKPYADFEEFSNDVAKSVDNAMLNVEIDE